jgi:hypothetical protein
LRGRLLQLAGLGVAGAAAASAVCAAASTGSAAPRNAVAGAAASSAPRSPDAGSAPGRAPEPASPTDRAAIETRWTEAQQRCARHPVAAVRKQCLMEARRAFDEAMARLR